MNVLVSGATGLVGRYIVEGLLQAGYSVIAGGRTAPPQHLFSAPVGYVPLSLDPDLDQIESFDGADFFVHAAFDHVPGRYRGGEGDDPERFLRLNLHGTIRLFETARRAGIRRAVFLSSRAVYDGHVSLCLTEDMELFPDTLYGRMKLDCERAISALSQPGFVTASIRPTGVYGDLRPNKWDAIFADFRKGRPVPVRAGTEVHGRDVAAAIRLMLETENHLVAGQSFNVSDIIVDTRNILGALQAGLQALPPLAHVKSIGVMTTEKIEALGWSPGGRRLFAETMETLAAAISAQV